MRDMRVAPHLRSVRADMLRIAAHELQRGRLDLVARGIDDAIADLPGTWRLCPFWDTRDAGLRRCMAASGHVVLFEVDEVRMVIRVRAVGHAHEDLHALLARRRPR